MTWSAQQDRALREIAAWRRTRGQQIFRLFGYAGTGKTTLARAAAADVRGTVLFAAFTGKAALVLRSKGCEGASTIHSLIYRAFEIEERDAQGNVVGVKIRYGLDPFSAVAGAALVIVDECSMVNEKLAQDLLSFGTPILVLGDPAQLPPVRGEGYFIAADPDVMLTEIHRQAADNPIIHLSTKVRNGGRLARGEYGNSRVIDIARFTPEVEAGSDQILVGMNRTRRALNARARRRLGRDPDYPEAGDRLVCLRNSKEKGLLNGGLWDIAEVEGFDEDGVDLRVASCDVDGQRADVYVRREFFEGCEETIPAAERRGTDEFTYGYALTVHKAQGSQWDDVLLIDESGAFRDNRSRHLYTGLTRAAERVTVVLS
jgi:ATP-dependent exoDNAse (exonuclease V) alpha subunit